MVSGGPRKSKPADNRKAIIERKRLEKGMTVSDLAYELALSESAASRKIRGETQFKSDEEDILFIALEFTKEDILEFRSTVKTPQAMEYYREILIDGKTDNGETL